jgi:hypothetical protein
MSLEKHKGIMNYGISKRVDVAFDATGTDTYQMSEHEELVYASGALGAGTVYLPPVSKCAGRIYTVIASSVATGSVTVAPFQMSDITPGAKLDSAMYSGAAAATSQALSGAQGFTTVYSTGDRWIVLAFDLSI